MAALQTLRNKPALLMSVIGGALLLFIVTMVLENQNSLFGPDMSVGEIYGKEINQEEFYNDVNEELNFYEVSSMLAGQQMTEQQREEIRNSVWEQYKYLGLIENELNAYGVKVSKEEIQKAMTNPQTHEVQFILSVANAFMGNPTLDGYKQFLANFDKQLAQVRQQNPGSEEILIKTKQACLYAEKRLAKSLLMTKYNALVSNGFTSNPVVVKMKFDEGNTEAIAEVATLVYSNVEDKDVTVSDEALKKMYEEKKDMFVNTSESRCIKIIHVPVVASPADRSNLMASVKKVEGDLRAANTVEQIKEIVGESNTSVAYQDIYFTKQYWTENRLYDIAGALDTLSVGFVKATSSDGQNISTYKLVDKVTTPDSLLVKVIAGRDKAQADSIITAVKAGSSLGDIALQLGQKDTATWENVNVYFGKSNISDSTVVANLSEIPVNGVGIVPMQGMYLVAQVLEAKAPTTKYNVAVVKCPVEFSDETYNSAKSKLDNFLANNKTVADFDANASKEGYRVETLPAFKTSDFQMISNLGGENARAAVRWAFDEAQPGDVSNVFECSDENGTSLLALGVQSVCEDKYLPWDNEEVKNALTVWVKNEAKAEKTMAQFKDVKDIAGAKLVKNVTHDTVTVALNRPPFNDYALAGALAKASKDQFVIVKGSNAAYAVKVLDKVAKNARYNEDAEMMNDMYRSMQNFGGIFNEMLDKYGKIKDNRYRF